MKDEKETKIKLLNSAKQEFMERGYMHSSLRRICKSAGVTTGALYFFFQDKEDLFASLVRVPLDKLYEVMNRHYQEELQEIGEHGGEKEDYTRDFEVIKMVTHYIYQYYDEFQLLLTKGQGSGFETCVDEFVKITEKHYRMLADQIADWKQIKKPDDYLIHWISHLQIDIFVHMLTHEKSEEEALQHISSIIQFLMSGWNGMFQK